jgi:hypothetical protein
MDMKQIGAITFVLLMMAVPAVAQSSRTSLTVMHKYVAADLLPPVVPIPDNFQFDPGYRALLESMLDRSPTFRRQCLRVANDPTLTVRLHPAGSVWTRGARALGHMVRGSGGGLVADIYLTRSADDVEMIAHEVEHVIEQLDQIDLSSRAARRDTGVHRTLPDGDTFETTRAMHTGLKVAREVRGPVRAD